MTVAGDWAFNLALDLAVAHGVRLDIFFFPVPPSQPHTARGRHGELAELPADKKVELERDVRLYYDQLLGEYLNVGFRLCEGDEEPELRRCLLIRQEYDVLVLPYEGYRCHFGSRTIEAFAESMPCPTLLVGPERADQIFLNSAATVRVDDLALARGEWKRLADVEIVSGQR
ncbi:MAG: hypothetical protein HC882_02695 [Acidobacteria bacterium]|nr:hypothetical protein [Acidobacteriota bacterium]